MKRKLRHHSLLCAIALKGKGRPKKRKKRGKLYKVPRSVLRKSGSKVPSPFKSRANAGKGVLGASKFGGDYGGIKGIQAERLKVSLVGRDGSRTEKRN